MEWEEQTTTTALAQKVIGEEDMVKFLEGCYVLFEIKGDEKNKKLVQAYLENQELMRKIRAIESIKENVENKAYYYSQDRGMNDPFEYQEATEARITSIRLQLLTAISGIIKEEENQDINIG